MDDPLTQLVRFTDGLANLDMVQSWLDAAREAFPDDPEYQFIIEAQQNRVNIRRNFIEMAMASIRSRN